MSYSVRLTAAAERQLRRLSGRVQERLVGALVLLELEPRPAGCRKLTGESQYRVRVGDYRIVYEVRDRELLVLALRVAHRRDVYRR